MPSIWKSFLRPKAEPYQFPKAEELAAEDFEPFVPPEGGGEGAEAPSFADEFSAALQAELAEAKQNSAPPEPEEPLDPVSLAEAQAEEIVKDAQRRAEEILAQAEQEAAAQAEKLYDTAKQEGFEAGRAEGITAGVAQALEENRAVQEAQAAEAVKEIDKFLEQAGAALDRQMEDNIEELRDLAIAIAEKVVSVSLKSSSEVIGKMIQAAVDKRKRREWAHIYIAECDAKHFTKVPASLTAALSSLSDRVRIIPMADDEAGTCIIEMPDEIIDASAATQLNNIRTLLSDAPTGGMDGSLNFGGLNFTGGGIQH